MKPYTNSLLQGFNTNSDFIAALVKVEYCQAQVPILDSSFFLELFSCNRPAYQELLAEIMERVNDHEWEDICLAAGTTAEEQEDLASTAWAELFEKILA